MQYFAKIDLNKLSIDASHRQIHHAKMQFIDKANQHVNPEIIQALSSGRVISRLEKYHQILNRSPLYGDLDKEYELRTYLYKQVERNCAEIASTESNNPNILGLKLVFYIDVLLYLQPKLGRNQVTYLYMQLEQDFQTTLQHLKCLPQSEENEAEPRPNLLFSFCYGLTSTKSSFSIANAYSKLYSKKI